MNLQHLQTDLCALIKSRAITNTNDEYINSVNSSQNLILVKKIALWWRKIQIENSCRLTANLLKSYNEFEAALSNFFKDEKYSAFREEVYIQFLQYIIYSNENKLVRLVAEFELSLMKIMLKEKIEISMAWDYDPYPIINTLLKNTFNNSNVRSGKYLVEVSYSNKELFTVKDLNA